MEDFLLQHSTLKQKISGDDILIHSIPGSQSFKRITDFVEERKGRLFGYEFKWSSKNIRPPRLWTDTYPEADWQIIDRSNYPDLIAGEDK